MNQNQMLEKIKSLNVYLREMEGRLTGDLPPKHKDGGKEYREYCKREVEMTRTKIDGLKLGLAGSGK